jgi:hypothetical protein
MSKKPKGIADRLRDEIRRREWTAYRLAKEADLAPTVALRFMRDENDPSLDNLAKILTALGWDIGPISGKEKRR